MFINRCLFRLSAAFQRQTRSTLGMFRCFTCGPQGDEQVR
jgi:hypothetical protein